MANQDFFRVEFRTYIFRGEVFTVRQDFWEQFDLCPEAEIITDRPVSIGVGTDDFTWNHSNLGVVWSDSDKDMMLMSRPCMMAI